MITSPPIRPLPGEYRSECRARRPYRDRVIGVNGDDNFFTVTRDASSIALSTTSNTMWCRPVPYPCRRYTYPGAYAPHPALSGFDTGGVIRIRHQRFSLIYTWLIRYFTLFHGKHLRIFVRHAITCSALIALTKTCDCVAFKGWQAARDAHHQAQRQNHLSGETPPPAFTGEELSLRQT